MRLTAKRKTDLGFCFIMSDTYSDVPKQRVRVAIGYSDLKPGARSKELRSTHPLEKFQSIRVRLL